MMSQRALPSAPPPPRGSLLRDFVLGGVATVAAVTFTNPLEVVKTRLQLQGELARRGQFVRHYNGALHAVYVIARNEGIVALQKGLVSAWFYQLAMNGTRLGSYDTLKRVVASQGGGWDRNFFVNVVCGAAAGVSGAFVGSPLYLVKTRLQSAGGLVGHQHHYRGVLDALTSIARGGGLRGLWRGAGAAMLRTGVGSAAQLSTYDKSKRLAIESGLVAPGFASNLTAAMVSGLVVATAMNPFDVISTRLYNQDPSQQLYKGPIDCLVKTWRTEGMLGFFKGFGAHYFRIGPHTILTFTFWELIKTAAVDFWPA